MKLLEQTPKSEPDIKIGSLSFWISEAEVIPQAEMSDWVVFSTPMLLHTTNISVYSPKSDIELFELNNLLNGFKEMVSKVGLEEVAIDIPLRESEFRFTFTCNLQGQIEIKIKYRAWDNNSQLEFREVIDQSYLPPIILKLESILKQY